MNLDGGVIDLNMRRPFSKIRLAACGVALLCASSLPAASGKLMHCFAFTPIATATDADWQAFYKATDELPSKIPGLLNVWYGKLRRPLTIVGQDGSKLVRQHGACMEMQDEATLTKYADHPAHKEWVAVYGKVRQPGTTTYDIISAK